MPTHPDVMTCLAVLLVSFSAGVGWSLGTWLVHKLLK